MTVTQIDPVEVSRKAAAYIREHGLAQFHLYITESHAAKCTHDCSVGSACFNGALLIALGGMPGRVSSFLPDELRLWDVRDKPGNLAEREVFNLIFDTANQLLQKRGTTPRSVVPWNNAPGRTAEEVAQLFDEIATELMTHGEG